MTVTVSVPTPPPSPYAVLRRKNFAIFWSGQLVSTIGSSLTSLAASILVYRETGSAASVGLMLIATAAPSLFVGLIAGVFVDRYDRKKIMIVSDILRGFLVFLIPFLVPLNIAWLYIIVALSAAIGQFFDPAHESVLPELAPDEELASANSLMAISSFGSTALGFAASGLIASQADIKWAFYLDALTFLVSAVLIYLVKIKPMEERGTTSVSVVIKNLRNGLGFLFGTPILRSLFFASIPVMIAFGLSNSLLLPFASVELGATEFEFGIQEGLTSLGFVVGSLMMANIAGRLYEGQWLTISFLGMGIAGVAYSFARTVPVAIIILMISGFMNAPSAIARRLIIQRNTTREIRGRVNSAFFVSRDILFLVGMASAGFADIIDVWVMYLISALMVLVTGIVVQFLPGLQQGAAEWRRSLRLLRSVPGAPGLGLGRAVTPADLDLLAGLLPQFSTLSNKERELVLHHGSIYDTPEGVTIIRHGDTGDTAYFLLSGQVVVGITSDNDVFNSISRLQSGDFFGEIAALTGAMRTASVVTEQRSTLLQVNAQTLRGLMGNAVLSEIILTKMRVRLSTVSIRDLPRFAGYDQDDIRELRTVEETV